jgi:hypothetical protein
MTFCLSPNICLFSATKNNTVHSNLYVQQLRLFTAEKNEKVKLFREDGVRPPFQNVRPRYPEQKLLSGEKAVLFIHPQISCSLSFLFGAFGVVGHLFGVQTLQQLEIEASEMLQCVCHLGRRICPTVIGTRIKTFEGSFGFMSKLWL